MGGDLASEQQVLLTGCYRTGTEYITLLLNNHPELAATMYVTNFMRFCYGRYNPVEERKNYTRLVLDTAHRMRIRWGQELDVHQVLNACDAAHKVDYGLIYDLMMSDCFLEDGVSRWAEKTQLVWSRIPDFLELFPQGKAIHVLRDPRSVLASFQRYTYAPEPAYLGAVFNCLSSMQHATRYAEKLNPDRYTAVRYEDMVEKPEDTVTYLFNFLGLSTEHDLLSEKGWTDARGEEWKHNSAFASEDSGQGEFDKQAALERWRGNLAPEDLALCEAVNAESMVRFGYEPSGSSVSWEEMIRKVLSDRKLTRYLGRWINQGVGVEEFPTDPLDPENWEENAERDANGG